MENDEKLETVKEIKHFFCVFKYRSELVTVWKTNLDDEKSSQLKAAFTQRHEKGQIHLGIGTVIVIDLGQECGCYYYTSEEQKDAEQTKFIICFVSENEHALDLFRADLDKYCSTMVPSLVTLSADNDIPDNTVTSLTNWHVMAVEYMVRCKQAIRENLKYLIHAALMDKKILLSGGTEELQSDIKKFYAACSLSDILNQLRESRLRSETGSPSGSVDMLLDLDSGQSDLPDTLTISITADSLKLDSSGCNKFCEEWANTMSRPEFSENPLRLKQVIEAFKLKFTQAMNTLKRLLKEAVNDYYALYRSYVFLRDSGNSEVLLHYVTTEAVADTAAVMVVLQDFIQEQNAF
ncbi:protein Njmu-R1-like [Mya arenaria]|uniref:protein Njmu-R1-like n=1 Tax=Mya arenaria TaxID=6604 RepID=UPI0022DEC94E|nr:protein Njmu-R1-like [Mya arenaria]